MNFTIPEIKEDLAQQMKANLLRSMGTSLLEFSLNQPINLEAAEEALEKMRIRMKFDNCPDKNEPVPPLTCQFCSFGHMLNCHYPYRCNDSESKCEKAEFEIPIEYE